MNSDYERTAKAIEVTRQRKYQRWAAEMRDHGWTCEAPTPERVDEIAFAIAAAKAASRKAAQGK